MAFSFIKQDNDVAYNLVELVCDSLADIQALPTTCAPGSSCICLEDASVYMLSTEKQWKQL